MKTLKTLTIAVTYTVTLTDATAPDKVVRQLKSLKESNSALDLSNPDIHDKDLNWTSYWVSKHIRETDSFNWEFEILNISE